MIAHSITRKEIEEFSREQWIEFDSMINIHPSCGNRSRFVEDENIRKLADGRWFALTLVEQMGNIGSEVGRTTSGFRRGNQEYADKAFVRLLELLDLTLLDDRWRGVKEERARARATLVVSSSKQK